MRHERFLDLRSPEVRDEQTLRQLDALPRGARDREPWGKSICAALVLAVVVAVMVIVL